MSFKDAEGAIFAEWQQRHDKSFVRDGVVDEYTFRASSPKIVYVLKEVNDFDGGGWDLRELLLGKLASGIPGKTWNNVTRWTMGLRDLSKDIPWSVLQNINEKQRKDTLKSVCVVNIKKTPGAGTADEKAVIQIAKQDEELLRKQLDFYKPDLVICCGRRLTDVYYKVFGENAVRQITSQSLPYWRSTNGLFVIVDHPQARKSAKALYDALIGSVQKITP